MASVIRQRDERPVESIAFPMGSHAKADAIKVHSTPPPSPKRRGGRPGKYRLAYETIVTLRPGEWIVVPKTESMSKNALWAAAGVLRRWVHEKGYDDQLRVYIDSEGRLIVYHVTKQDVEDDGGKP